MCRIVIATLNARYSHSSFGLRYLLANMSELQGDTKLLEFVIGGSTFDVLDAILAEQPRIVGLGVYIWNVEQMTRLVADLKRLRPNTIVVLGGPEVSYETDDQPIVQLADYVVCGEADLAFADLCRRILNDDRPTEKILSAPLPQFQQIRLPYEFYSDEDIANRVIYVEASRGCPFTCEFCLSALEIPVRQADTDEFLQAMQRLFERGVRHFKFVDRTFNLNVRVSQRILQFFLERIQPGMFLHFEMIPDRLPDALRGLIAQFPAGVLQFEIGVQTFTEEVGELISRRQNNQKLEENFRFLREQTTVHIHADLIIGLPGETWESFAASFDRLYALKPQEIQLGILKRLKGTPIVRHDQEWQMVYSPNPPYEILSNRLLSFEQLSRLRRMARFWDLIGNSGNFVDALQLIIDVSGSAFDQFLQLSEWLFECEQRRHGISLVRLMELVLQFAVEVKQLDEPLVAQTLWKDYVRVGRRDIPQFLRNFGLTQPPRRRLEPSIPARQQRHMAE